MTRLRPIQICVLTQQGSRCLRTLPSNKLCKSLSHSNNKTPLLSSTKASLPSSHFAPRTSLDAFCSLPDLIFCRVPLSTTVFFCFPSHVSSLCTSAPSDTFIFIAKAASPTASHHTSPDAITTCLDTTTPPQFGRHRRPFLPTNGRHHQQPSRRIALRDILIPRLLRSQRMYTSQQSFQYHHQAF